ncbi:MAG: hypothetical protein M3O26_20985 [Pseudomonadota bacterium]|nr:hypothetical protein [Pseudomonadota bacterium]
MSLADTMTPLLSAPWFDAAGRHLPVRVLPGIRPEFIQPSGCSSHFGPALKELLTACSGLDGTALGLIDFTGCRFPEEPCRVFNPCITLAIDDAGRRWIAELTDGNLTGPVWCMFPDPKVAVYVSDSLVGFIGTLQRCARRANTLEWLQDLSAQARIVWYRRQALARRPHEVHESDEQIRSWLLALPSDAYVYDLRRPMIARGWPYGLAGPSGRLYRCARLPVFAVTGSPSEGCRQVSSATIPPADPAAKARPVLVHPTARRVPRRSRSQPISARRPPCGYDGAERRSTHSSRPPRDVSPERTNFLRRKLGVARISLWTLGTLSWCAVMPEAVAGDLLQTASGLWAAPAAALSLTLLTAVKGSQR